MTNNRLEELTIKAINEKNTGIEEASDIARFGAEQPFEIIAAADRIRKYYKGKKVSLCGIVNAKSGLCPEDCHFCAQSAHYCTGAPEYEFIGKEAIVEKARQAKKSGAHMFGIVTSGTRVNSEEEWKEMYSTIKAINDLGLRACVSLGMLDSDRAASLKEAGLFRYHHNLETARSHFNAICSTHAYEEDIETVIAAKNAGLSTCSGGIIGLGESMEQRIELAFTLKDLNVDCIPINILNPRQGTPLQNMQHLAPIELLVSIAVFRFILPDKDIKLCGGKEANLRQLLPLGIIAGCNSLMIGDYLTTPGRTSELDVEMVRDLGLEPSFE
jgi:biotin synthase